MSQKRRVRYEVDFLHADKHQSSLQFGIIVFDGSDQTYSKYPK